MVFGHSSGRNDNFYVYGQQDTLNFQVFPPLFLMFLFKPKLFFSLPIGILNKEQCRQNNSGYFAPPTYLDAWNLNVYSMGDIIVMNCDGNWFVCCFHIEKLLMMLHVENSVKYFICLIKHMKWKINDPRHLNC